MKKLIVKTCLLSLCFIAVVFGEDTLEISNKLPNDNRLIENLKELFVVEDKVNINPQKHVGLYLLVDAGVLKDLSSIKSISTYYISDISKKGDGISFQIWDFDNKNNAKQYFNAMSRVNADYRFEKPPKYFFLVSNKLYYFVTKYDYNTNFVLLARDKLIDCCFSKSEVLFSRNPYDFYKE